MPDLNYLIRTDFVVLIPFLNVLGAILKYRTQINNKKLPVLLFIVAVVMCALWGYFISSLGGGARWMDALLMCGLVHGLIVTSIAVWGWDAFFGLYKTGIARTSPHAPVRKRAKHIKEEA